MSLRTTTSNPQAEAPRVHSCSIGALCIIAFALIWIAGCTRIPHLVLWNNSGRTLVIDSDAKTYHCAQDEAVRMIFPGNTMALSIRHGPSGSWRYEVRYPEKKFIIKNSIFVQIEPDGSIHLLAGETVEPAKSFPRQPVGFPLLPRP